MSYEIGTGDLQQISSVSSANATSAAQPRQAGQAGDGSEPVTVDADRTNLSSFGGLVSQALGNSDARAAKVASLQAAISSGQYHVSSSDVADKLLQSLLER